MLFDSTPLVQKAPKSFTEPKLTVSFLSLSPPQKGHSHFHAKVFRQELVDTAPLDEPQGRLGDSERWMSWEPKAPLAVPDHLGDSTEDDDDSEEDTTDEDTSEIEPEVVADRKPVHADPDLADDEDSRDESKEESKGRWRCCSYFRFESMDQSIHGLQK